MTGTEDWSEAVTAAAEPPAAEVKLFGRWNPDEIHVNDISLAVSPVPLASGIQTSSRCNMRAGLLFVFVGLHICEGEGSKVFTPHLWSICSQTF